MKSFFRKQTKPEAPKPITIVSGLPRSGTSMMMKMLEAGGMTVMTDQIRSADDDNPKGYFEFERVKQLDKGDTTWIADAQGKVVKVISALVKYLPLEYRYQIVFVRRAMPEILASQRKMLIRRGEDPDKVDDAQMAVAFDKHLRQVESWLAQQPNMQVLYVHYSNMLGEPETEIRQINAFLGGGLDTAAMAAAIDPQLYRNRQPSA